MNGRLLALLAGTAVLAFVAHRLRRYLPVERPLREIALPEPQSEAERLARLLVTEIKLYNFQEIEATARGTAEPSQELCAEIDSSRAMYSQRIPLADQANHFETAVLQILAYGNDVACARLLRRG